MPEILTKIYQYIKIGNIQVEQFILACQESLCQNILHEEEADYEENKENHRMLTCVVCDEAIIGKDVYHWIDRKTLKCHGNVLSHTNFYKKVLHPPSE